MGGLSDVQAAGASFTTRLRAGGYSDGVVTVESGTRQAATAKSRTEVTQVEHGGEFAGLAPKVQAGWLTGAAGLAVAAGVVLAVVGGGFLLVRSGRRRPGVLGRPERLVCTKVRR